MIYIQQQFYEIYSYAQNNTWLKCIENINIIYLQSKKMFGLLIHYQSYANCTSTEDMKIFNNFKYIYFIKDECYKYWKCPQTLLLGVCNSMNAISMNSNLMVCRNCTSDFELDDENVGHIQMRSVLKYRLLLPHQPLINDYQQNRNENSIQNLFESMTHVYIIFLCMFFCLY